MIVAVPMPPPMHSVTSAVDLLVRSSSSSTVPKIIAPVAPSGWPSAIAPPLTLIFELIDVEGLDVAQHHRRESFVQLEQVDVRFLHAGAFEQLFGDVDRTGQHHRRLRADIGEGADFCARLQAMFGARFLAAEQHRAGAVNDAGGVAGMVHIVDPFDFRVRLDRDGIKTAHHAHRHE